MRIKLVSSKLTNRGDAPYEWEVTLDVEGFQVKKFVRISNAFFKVCGGNPAAIWQEIMYSTNKALVEAERDALYKKYGKDWQKHDKLRLRVWGVRTEPHPDLTVILETLKEQQTK